MLKRSLLTTAVMALTLSAAVGAHAETAAKAPAKAAGKAAAKPAEKAAAGNQLTPYTGDLPAPLALAKSAGQLEVFKTFPAAGELTGWVVQDTQSGKNLIVYTTKDREVLMAGMALDKAGKNLTGIYAEEHIPAPDYSAALAEFNTKATTVVVGNPKAKASVTVIFDANCGYCKLMHKLITPAVEAGELRVTYVPVAILGADSDLKAAGILAAKNPGEAVHDAAEGRAAATNDKELLAKVIANTAMMKKHGFTGTPGVLYKGVRNGEDTVFVANGVPNITDMFAKMGINGQVDQLKKDPNLSKYLAN